MACPRILIVGAGSAGRRHARNLVQLGAEVACFDPRADRLAQAAEELPAGTAIYSSWEEALDSREQTTGAVVASPPAFHVKQATALVERGVPTLLEKPVAPNLAPAMALAAAAERAKTPVLVGYSYRWWPPVQELRRLLAEGRVGRVRHARLVMSAHLADWHPWERYQDFFMASKELGGGALLDESHFVDLMLWLFGLPESVIGRAEKLSDLEIETDDNVDVLAVYPDNLRVAIHLDLYGRPHERSVSVVGERGTLQWLHEGNLVRFSDQEAGGWETTTFECERNEMFLGEARELLELLRGERGDGLTCSLADGVDVLRCVEAIRRSTATGEAVVLGADARG